MSRIKLSVVTFVVGSLWANVSLAHVRFSTEPNSVFVPGTEATLTWFDSIPHDTLGYQLEIFWDAEAEPVRIVSDLSPGSTSYLWQVPERECDACRLHVIQDNSGADYGAFLAIRIAAPLGSAGAGGATPDATAVATTASMMNGAGGVGGQNLAVETASAAGSLGGSSNMAQQASTTGANMIPQSGGSSAGSSCTLGVGSHDDRVTLWGLLGFVMLGVRRRASRGLSIAKVH